MNKVQSITPEGQAALISEDDLSFLVRSMGLPSDYAPALTPWGVREEVVERVFQGTPKDAPEKAPLVVVAPVGIIAKAAVEFALTQPALAVRHVNTDVVVGTQDAPHLQEPHYGKSPWLWLPILIANTHGDWFEKGQHTIRVDEAIPASEWDEVKLPWKRGISYILRGYGMPDVPDSRTFFCEDMTLPNRKGTLHTPDNFEDALLKKLYVFGGTDCVKAIRDVLTDPDGLGLDFCEEPRGWERRGVQDSAIAAVMKQYPNWPNILHPSKQTN